jgi:UDP-N-acetylmuramate dehydrogenase
MVPDAHVPLAPFTSLGLGGPARWFARAASADDAAAALRWSLDRGAPLFVLGGGSNVVIADEGFDGLVLQIAMKGLAFEEHGATTTLAAAAGEPWDDVVAAAVSRDLAGLECLSGIPGSAGGTPVQNVGAYGQEVAATIDAVSVLDRLTGEALAIRGADCGFAYRMSRFKGADAERFIVCDIRFTLRTDAPTITYPDVRAELGRMGIAAPDLRDVRRAVLAVRRRKGMVIDAADSDTRSVGSFFMNPVVSGERYAELTSKVTARPPGFELPGGDVKVPAAWLIEESGFARGHVAGAAGLSSKHPLAIVNRGGATARDVLALAVQIKRRVGERFGIWLRPEPAFVGFRDDADVSFLQKAER